MATAKRHEVGDPFQLIKKLERRVRILETTPRTQIGATQSIVVATQENRGSVAYGDVATVGPTATVLVGQSGVVLVTISCLFVMSFVNGNAGFMSFEIRDAAAALVAGWSATDSHCAEYHISNDATDPVPSPPRSATFTVTGLTPFATYTFKAKYRSNPAIATDFSNRALTVIPI